MRTPWCCSYFSLRPRRMEMVSSTVGSDTNTGWKRRASAASFSMCFLYSSSVVAPTQCSSPRASAGLSRLPASMAPSALPAPTMVCSSSMNRMILPPSACTSDSTALSRSSNSPRYLAPAISAPMSSASSFLSFRLSGTSPLTMRWAKPFGDRRLADARLADQHGVVLGAPGQHLDGAPDLLVAADDGVDFALCSKGGQVAGIALERIIALLGTRRCRRCGPCGCR